MEHEWQIAGHVRAVQPIFSDSFRAESHGYVREIRK
jgi:hypothetical protein